MAKQPKHAEALELVLAMNFPPTTLTIDPGKAAGHRLAKPVTANGNLPARPFALVDGLAVTADDTNVSQPQRRDEESDYAEEPAEGDGKPRTFEGSNLTRYRGTEPAELRDTPAAQSAASLDVKFALREFPRSNRREDALQPGQAISVPVGGEVPRGGELVIPLTELVEEPVEEAPPELPPPPPPPSPRDRQSADGEDDENGDLPVAEPVRNWDLPSRFAEGEVELAQVDARPGDGMVGIGSWARNRQVLIPDKTIMRAPDIALLKALQVEEVEIYRRPVIGVASLGHPFPEAGKHNERSKQEGVCPLMTLATQLSRAARVASLPLGFAPHGFRRLTHYVERWLSQVDILLLVGGSHHAAHSLGRDIITAMGELSIDGLSIEPGSCTTAGSVKNKPVFSMPGGLPEVLVAFTLLVRPLAHKYLTPHNYQPSIELALEQGSKLRVELDTVVPVRYSFSHELGLNFTRYSGRRYDPWLDYIKGQALIVLEGGHEYQDGEVVTAYSY